MNRCGIFGTELKPDEEDEGICRNCHDLLSMSKRLWINVCYPRIYKLIVVSNNGI